MANDKTPTHFQYDIHVEVFVNRDASVARLTHEDGAVTGSSRRLPEDKFNYEVGADLAVARALEQAAKNLYRKHGNALVRQKKTASDEPVHGVSSPVSPEVSLRESFADLTESIKEGIRQLEAALPSPLPGWLFTLSKRDNENKQEEK